ncbi:DUF4381 domain-containing protein [Endozoicomonas numazuensis]|uniref:DUF4381 domain-containing protein n=1 Tax=Endozoicomonas numazuensis TaxID=1137799 RepID=UPI00068DC561|nr:DUF4381 domain-containing protein [Endozoicomonas numazuensis]
MTQNPLDQLRPNHLPDPVSFWPPAPGWWLSAVLVIAVITLITVLLIRYIRRNRYRRQARQQANILFNAFQKHQNPLQFANDCNRLLKKTALHAYPAEQVAPLYGNAWLDFLSRKSGITAFSAKPGQALGDTRFKPTPKVKDKQEVDVDQLHKLTVSWIRKHHA